MSTPQARPGRPVAEALREAIEDHGPITFAEFMEIALYGAGGFYDQPPVGERGDFVTSPHVHPVFGSLLARGIRGCWEELGRPDPFVLVELGAGDGTLAGQLLETLADVPVRYVAVERSRGGRARLSELPVEILASFEALGDVEGCVIANELLDNLPFHWVRHTEEDLVERRVRLARNETLAYVDVPCPALLLEEWPELNELLPGEDTMVHLEALRLIDRLARILRRGYALLADYASAPGLGSAGVHGYRGHRVIEDLLEEPGRVDITAGVDFTVLLHRARSLGMAALPTASQRDALLTLGYGDWDENRRRRQGELVAERSGREAVGLWSERNGASLLVDPSGLGRLRWAALAAGGVPWPEWLLAAQEEELVPLLENDPALGGSLGRTSGRRRRPRRTRCP